MQICPGLNANEIQIPYDNHHKVSSLVKRHQNTYNYVKYEVIWKHQITLLNMRYFFKQYLRSILDISEILRALAIWVSDSQICLPSVIFAPPEEYLWPKNDSCIMHFLGISQSRRLSLPFCVELSYSGPILRHLVIQDRTLELKCLWHEK